jgi:hypothetical protein
MPKEEIAAAQDEVAAFTAKDLIEDASVEEDTFDIPLRTGRKIVVRKVKEYRTIVALRKRQATIMRAVEKNALPPSWKPYLPITSETAEIIADITGLVVHPKFSDVDVLELCRRGGMTAVYLHGLIKKSWQDSVPAAEVEEIEEIKND